jgi:hypothetical protein
MMCLYGLLGGTLYNAAAGTEKRYAFIARASLSLMPVKLG